MSYISTTIAVLLHNIFYLVQIILQLKIIFTSHLTWGLKLSFAAVSNVSCYHKLATGCSKAQFKRKGSLAGNYTTTNIYHNKYVFQWNAYRPPVDLHGGGLGECTPQGRHPLPPWTNMSRTVCGW